MPEIDLQVTDLARELLMTALILAAPALLIGLVVGLAVSLFQALTSVQEQTMSLIPKMFAVLFVTLILLAPMMQLMRDYTLRVFDQLHIFGLS